MSINKFPNGYSLKTQRLTTSTANISITSNDNGLLYYCDNSTDIVISLSESESLKMPVGAQIDFIRANANVTFNAAPANTTISSANSATKLRLQWSACSFIKVTANKWVIIGDITT